MSILTHMTQNLDSARNMVLAGASKNVDSISKNLFAILAYHFPNLAYLSATSAYHSLTSAYHSPSCRNTSEIRVCTRDFSGVRD
ncbi:MAG: hypothetical protein LBJ67_13620 [Planctomycetaceae bacterium]|nr:hypothetical protein [Planctomycetaceae bacterium]